MTATMELRMPLGFVEVAAEEMEYLDGGARYVGYLNPNVCKGICRAYQVGSAASGFIGLLSGCMGAIPASILSVVVAIKCTTRSWFWEDAAARNGANVYFDWRGFFFRQR